MKEDVALTWAAGVGTALFSFFSPIAGMMYVIIFVVMMDMLTAILRAWSECKPTQAEWWRRARQKMKVIQYEGVLKSTLKFCLYILFIAGIYAAEVVIIGRSVYITNFAAFLIIFGELLSVAKNLDIVLKTNKFTTIITKVRKVFENKIVERITTEKCPEEQPGESDNPEIK